MDFNNRVIKIIGAVILLGLIVGGGVIYYQSNHKMQMDRNNASANNATMKMSQSNTGNVDQDFINDMIAHHLGAIEMAKQAETKSTREEVRNIAKAIIQVQQKEVDELYKWKKEWFKDEVKVETPKVEDLGASQNEFDLAFINAMVPHHREGIKMSEEIRKQSTRQEILGLADNIITTQVKEVQMMEKWREEWFVEKMW